MPKVAIAHQHESSFFTSKVFTRLMLTVHYGNREYLNTSKLITFEHGKDSINKVNCPKTV